MKKIISFAAIAAVAVLTAACAKEQNLLNENAVSGGMRTLTFTGITGNPALNKTSLGEDGVGVNWDEDDSLFVFYHENDGIRVGASIAHIISIDGDTGAATFSVKVAEDAKLDVVCACYNPVDRGDNILTHNPLTLNPTKKDDGICTYARAEFKTRQIAKKNSFDRECASMVARWINDGSDTPFFDFYNLGAFVNFEIDNKSSYQIDSVSISFDGSFFRYYYGFNDAEDATDDINIYTTSGKYNEVTLVGPIESGVKYYIAMTPNTNFATPKIRFHVNGWGVKEFSNETTIRLARNQSLNIGKFSFDDSSFPCALSLTKTGTEILAGNTMSFDILSASVDWTATITKGGVAAGSLDVYSGTSGTTTVNVTLPVNTSGEDAEYLVTVHSTNPAVEDQTFTIRQIYAVDFGSSWTKTWFSAWRTSYLATPKIPYDADGLYADTIVSTGQLYSSGKLKGVGTFKFVAKTAGQGTVGIYIQAGSVDITKNGVAVETLAESGSTPTLHTSAAFAVNVGDVISLKQTKSAGFIGFTSSTAGIFWNAVQ